MERKALRGWMFQPFKTVNKKVVIQSGHLLLSSADAFRKREEQLRIT